MIFLLMIFTLMPVTALATEGAEYDDGAFHYTELSDGALTVSGLSSSYSGGGDLTIPDSYNGMAVTAISDSAFINNHKITSVAIPAGITSIGKSAFQSCISLNSVTLAADSSLQTIVDYAFLNTALTSVTIPSGVISIGAGAFQSCASLSSVTFAANSSLGTIGKYAFYNAPLTSVTIPASVISIGDSAFESCTSLGSVTFTGNSTLKTIGDKAFFSTPLTSVAIPASMTSIGERAFQSCASLSSVTFASNSSLKTIKNYAFYGTPINFVTIPASVTSIGDNAFDACGILGTVTFAANSSLNTIGNEAFMGTALTSVTIPSGVTSIGNGTFSWCGLNSITFSVNSVLNTIGSNAFSNTPLSSVAIPSGVTSIGDHAFDSCDNLTSLTFAANSSLKAIGYRAFATTALTSVVIPASVTSIGDNAFLGCGNLGSLTFAANSRLKTIGEAAFGITVLTSVVIPPSVTSIGFGAFIQTKLTKAVILSKNAVFDNSVFSSAPMTDGIYGFSGSTAQTYASSKSIPFHMLCGITFDSRGGSDVPFGYAVSGETVSKPADPTQAGKVFKGWYTGSDCSGNAVSFPYTVTTDTTLYAKWMPLYTVMFDSKGGGSVSSQTVEEGSKTAKPSDPVLAGQVFGGWYSDSALTHEWDFGADTVTADTTLYAKWTPLYTVTFDSKGGGAVASQTLEEGSKAIKPTDPVLTGNVFGGWYKDTALTHEWDFGADTVTADTTLYAKWTKLVISSSSKDGKVYTGGRIVLTPSVPGGTWSFDSAYLSLSDNTFTALKAGKTRVTYTAGGQSAYYDVTIQDSNLPQTGQNFGFVYVLVGLACITAVIGSLIVGLKKKAR